MSSSRGSDSQGLDGYSKQSSSFSIGSEGLSNSVSRQQHFGHQSPLPLDMGLRIAAIADAGEDQYPESTSRHNPVYAHDANLSRSTPSLIPLGSFPHLYSTGVSGSSPYPTSGSFYSPNASPFSVPDNTSSLRYHPSDIRPSLPYQQSPDGRSILGTYTSSPIMAPPTRSPNLSHLNNPITARELYTSQTPQLRRSDLLSRSPSASSNIRGGAPLSPSPSSGLASPATMENPNSGPPLNETEHFVILRSSDGQPVRPEILGKVDKGFFKADGDWTCYRRNYFQLSCSYTVHPWVPVNNVLLVQNSNSHAVHGFAMTISAVVDSRDGRPIELVQHTPKRDKGPQMRPDRVTLAPRPHPPANAYGPNGEMGIGQRAIYDPGFTTAPNQIQTEHTYERIQFKCATANNGRRRAAQQYYHLVVELHVDLGPQMGDAPDRFVKVAQRISAPVVVRGRSPGHYHSERRHSNASAGGNAGQSGGGGSYESNNGIHRNSVQHMSVPGSSSMVSGVGYNEHYDQRTVHYSRANIEVPMDPIMSAEDIKTIDESEGYLYYPSPLYEGTGVSLPHMRSQLDISNHRASHAMASFQSHANPGPRIKQEPGSSTGYILPSLTAGPLAEHVGRNLGRFDGLPSSKGFYPTVFTHSELNPL